MKKSIFLLFIAGVIFFAGSPSFGVIREQVYTSLTQEVAFVSSPSSDNVFSSQSFGKKILKSGDAGSSWSDLYSFPSAFPMALCFVNSQKGFVLASLGGASREVYETINGGITFTREESLGTFSYSGFPTIKSFGEDDVAIITSSKSYYLTTNNSGTTWTTKDVTGLTGITSLTFLSPLEIVSTGRYSNEFVPGSFVRAYKSVDGGLSWAQKFSTPEGEAAILDVFSNGDKEVFFALTDSVTPETYNTYIYKSTNEGESFSSVSRIDAVITRLFFADGSIGWASGMDRSLSPTVYRTLDGGVNWEKVYSSSVIGYFYDATGVSNTWQYWASSAPSNPSGLSVPVVVGNEPPKNILASPLTLEAGTAESITITGENFETLSPVFNVSSTFEISGAGIRLDSFSVVSSTEITAILTVSSSASSGRRTLTIVNPDNSLGTGEIFIGSSEPVGSFEITSITPSSFDKGVKTRGTVIGKGFSLFATFEGSSGISIEGIYIFSSTDARIMVNVSTEALGSLGSIVAINPDGGRATKTVVLKDEEKIKVTLLPLYNNVRGLSSWNPDRGSLKVYLDKIPKDPKGKVVVPSQLSGFKMDVDFSSGYVELKKENFQNSSPSNGIHKVYLFDNNGNIIGQTKVVIFR